MTPRKNVYFRETTYQQRKLMIETYEETDSVARAVEAAKVDRKPDGTIGTRRREGHCKSCT
jgi:hypothetical protein